MEWLTKDLRELYERAKGFQQGQAPSPSYCTGCTDGFYEGVRYVFDKIAEQSNEPLTLEELRGMDGEPVWVEFPKCPEASGWMLIPASRHCVCNGLLGDCDFENCGRTWLAYRRRPEEERKR